jgi:hypothetical protein
MSPDFVFYATLAPAAVVMLAMMAPALFVGIRLVAVPLLRLLVPIIVRAAKAIIISLSAMAVLLITFDAMVVTAEARAAPPCTAATVQDAYGAAAAGQTTQTPNILRDSAEKVILPLRVARVDKKAEFACRHVLTSLQEIARLRRQVEAGQQLTEAEVRALEARINAEIDVLVGELERLRRELDRIRNRPGCPVPQTVFNHKTWKCEARA